VIDLCQILLEWYHSTWFIGPLVDVINNDTFDLSQLENKLEMG